MVLLRSFLIILTALLVISCSQTTVPQKVTDGNYSTEVYRTMSGEATTEAELVATYQEFITYADDIDVVRRVQSDWESFDETAARAFALNQHNSEGTAKSAYLLGRVSETAAKSIELGKKAIALDENFAYGYRLVLATYDRALFSGDKGSDDYIALAKTIDADAGLFDKFIALENKTTAYQFKFNYNIYKKDTEAAQATIEAGAALEDKWPGFAENTILAAAKGEYAQALTLVTDEINKMKESNPEIEADRYIDYYYSDALRQVGAFDELVEFKSSADGFDKNHEALYDLACLFSLNGDNDKAFDYLSQSVANGWGNYEHMQQDSDLTPLHAIEGWDGLVADAKSNWDSGADERKKEILEGKVKEEAPLWSLEDVNGNMVNLADLKGNVIILDFWATWCGPCRMAMPEIDNFIKNRMPANVRVFSINVFEKGKVKPPKFLKDNNYAMELLYGNDDISKDYDFNGIPFLCVIDQEGFIRFKHLGYDSGLGEYLDLWVADLM